MTYNLLGCNLRKSDESKIRDEFDIPHSAQVLSYLAKPEKPGWFGREGLKITMVFQLNDNDFKTYFMAVSQSSDWSKLPIPGPLLKRMGAIKSRKRSRVESYKARGETEPPEGSIYNPTEQQMFEQFMASLPPQPQNGLFQVRTAGDDIMNAKTRIYRRIDRDINDFMLAMLDYDRKQIVIRVSTGY
jgi:hypothetical protein